jgi:SAM-dependent methyltransferase
MMAPPDEGLGLRRKLRRLRDHRRVFGLWHTLRSVVARIAAPPAGDGFDAQYGVATDGDFTAPDVTSPNRAFASPYQPTHARVLRDVLRRLPIELPSTTFVDLGCGKGRALLMAAEHPFRRILGIDFSEVLCRDAEANVASFARRFPARLRCPRVEVACADVCDLAVPEGDVVFYLFNPFEPPVLERVLARIAAAARASPRRILIAYCHAKYGTEALEQQGCVKIDETSVLTPWWSWSLWRWPERGEDPLPPAARRAARPELRADAARSDAP